MSTQQSTRKNIRMTLGIIQGLPAKYATPIRVENLTRRLPCKRLVIGPKTWPKTTPGKVLLVLKQAFQTLKPSFKPDVLFASAPLIASAFPAVLASKLRGIPLVTDWDDSFLDLSKHDPPFWSFHYWEKKAVQRAAAVTVVADRLVEIAEDLGQKNVFYLPNGVDLNQFDPKKTKQAADKLRKQYGFTKSDCVVGFQGSINLSGDSYVGKKITDIAEKAHPWMKFFIIGFGPGLEPFKRDVQRRGLSSRFVFTGYVPHNKIAAYMNVVDIAAVPFNEKLFTALCRSSCKMKEFLALGKPIVSVAIGENLKDVPARCGVLVKRNQDLGIGLKKLCTNCKRLRVSRIRKHARNYEFKRLAKILREAVESARETR